VVVVVGAVVVVVGAVVVVVGAVVVVVGAVVVVVGAVVVVVGAVVVVVDPPSSSTKVLVSSDTSPSASVTVSFAKWVPGELNVRVACGPVAVVPSENCQS